MSSMRFWNPECTTVPLITHLVANNIIFSCLFLSKTNEQKWEFYWNLNFSSVNTKKFANFLEFLAKFSISQN